MRQRSKFFLLVTWCFILVTLLICGAGFIGYYAHAHAMATQADTGYTLYVGECYSMLMPKDGKTITLALPGWPVEKVHEYAAKNVPPNPGITRVVCMAGIADMVELKKRGKTLDSVRAECLKLGDTLKVVYKCPVNVLDPHTMHQFVLLNKFPGVDITTDGIHLNARGYEMLYDAMQSDSAWLRREF